MSDSLPLPLASDIVELTDTSFKITTSFPLQDDPQNPLAIRIAFRAK